MKINFLQTKRDEDTELRHEPKRIFKKEDTTISWMRMFVC